MFSYSFGRLDFEGMERGLDVIAEDNFVGGEHYRYVIKDEDGNEFLVKTLHELHDEIMSREKVPLNLGF